MPQRRERVTAARTLALAAVLLGATAARAGPWHFGSLLDAQRSARWQEKGRIAEQGRAVPVDTVRAPLAAVGSDSDAGARQASNAENAASEVGRTVQRASADDGGPPPASSSASTAELAQADWERRRLVLANHTDWTEGEWVGRTPLGPDAPAWPNSLAVCLMTQTEHVDNIREWLQYHLCACAPARPAKPAHALPPLEPFPP